MVCAEASQDFLFHFCHVDFPFSGIIGEADIGVRDEARDRGRVSYETVMQVVGFGFCDPSAFSLPDFDGFFWKNFYFQLLEFCARHCI